MEVAVPVGEATIPELLNMVDMQRPEIAQCMGVTALHMLSTWMPTNYQVCNTVKPKSRSE